MRSAIFFETKKLHLIATNFIDQIHNALYGLYDPP